MAGKRVKRTRYTTTVEWLRDKPQKPHAWKYETGRKRGRRKKR
jgi:hypothetical protein